MICPSCNHPNEESIRFCARCRMRFSPLNLSFTKLRDDVFWVLRRAFAGFGAGLIAWFFMSFASRILAQTSIPIFYLPLMGFMGGAFLGTVDGMMDESTPKTVWGAVLGGMGGLLGGFVFSLIKNAMAPDQLFLAVFVYWSIAGAAVGMVSAMWEKQSKKLWVGILAGFFGGGIGGYLGAGIHTNLMTVLDPQSWLAIRLTEALIGGVIGLTLWLFVGAAERFYIFNRRLLKHQSKKVCDKCQHKNPLISWYCGECGSVLQVSAPPDELNFPPYKTLTRIKETFDYLSRLSATTGFIAGFVSLFVFIPGDPFLITLVLVLTALISYGLQCLFSSISEGMMIFLKK